MFNTKDLLKLRSLDPRALARGESTVDLVFPNPEYNRDAIQEKRTQELEIDPKKYYPPDVYREPTPHFPRNFRINPLKMIWQKLEDRLEGKLHDLFDSVGDAKLKEQLKDKLREILKDLID